MYYILNATNQIIAADKDILKACEVSHINDLYSLVISKQIKFNIVDNILIINDKSFKITKTPLSSLLGSLTIVSVSNESKNENKEIEEIIKEVPTQPIIENIVEDISDDDLLDSLTIEDDIVEENDELSLETDELSLEIDDIFDEPKTEEKVEELITDDLDIDNLFDEPLEKKIVKIEEPTLDDLDIDDLFAEPQEKKIEKIAELTIDDLDIDDLFDEPEEKKIKKVDEPKVGEVIDDDFDSILDDINDEDEILINQFDENEDKDKDEDDDEEEEDESEILIDITKASEDIGIDTDDYLNFLEEYIDTAINYEDDIRENTNEKDEAISTLINLSDVLHLYEIGEIIKSIDTIAPNKQSKAIDRFYASLSRISTFESEDKNTVEEEIIDDFIEEPKKEEIVHKPTISEQTIPRSNSKSFGTISLDGIKPIHFDFRLEEAADDLSLPVDLIEEFVNDFIDQAKVETEKMIKAYDEGNLDTIQKIGHLLKGTASNLRIKALADTLYKIQFCENHDDLEDFITDYWGHFLSFEIQIKAISH